MRDMWACARAWVRSQLTWVGTQLEHERHGLGLGLGNGQGHGLGHVNGLGHWVGHPRG